MSHISTRACEGGIPPIDSIQFSNPLAWYFLPDAQSDMEHNNYLPYPPNSMANDNIYLYPSPNPEERSPQSYTDFPQYNASQLPSSHGLPNDSRYYTSLGPHQLHNQELGWGSGMQQQFETHNTNMPHDMSNMQHSAPGYSTYPHANNFLPASYPYPMGGDSSHFTPASPMDPNAGRIFYPSTEGPRLRTAQACQKCRARKAKCSGDHPSCERCLTRGFVCEYAPEGRTRGPNKPRIKVDPGPSSGPSEGSRHYPMSGAETSGQNRPEHNLFAYDSAEFVRRHSIGGHTLVASYAASPVMHDSEGSMSGSSAGTPSSARSTPITSPGVNSPVFGAEMTMDSHQRNAGSWLTHPAYDRHYDHPERRASP